MSIEHKITPVSDSVCEQCCQLWEGECRAYSMPHSEAEREHRTSNYGLECDSPETKKRRAMVYDQRYHT